MKNVILLTLLLLPPLILLKAQQVKETSQEFSLPASKKVELNLKFGNSIVVKPSSNSKLVLHTKITYSLPELVDIHEIDVDAGSDKLDIETDYNFDDLKNHDEYHCWSCDIKSMATGKCVCLEVNYVVELPAKAILSLETISGDIELLGIDANVRAKSISGFVDLSLSQKAGASLLFKTVTGEIYTDFEIDLTKNSTSYAKRVDTNLNGGGAEITLETVSGDIFFRKI